jgi:amidophosphoribosyltransferase
VKLNEECGVFGGLSFKGNIAPYIRNGLFMLQHRGQESAGVCWREKQLSVIKDKRLVTQVLTDEVVTSISGRFGIGHVRYSTQGNSDAAHAQPYLIKYLGEDVAVAHNGNVSKAMKMRKKFEKMGEVFLTSSDTEVMLKRLFLVSEKNRRNGLFRKLQII